MQVASDFKSFIGYPNILIEFISSSSLCLAVTLMVNKTKIGWFDNNNNCIFVSPSG